MFTFNLLSGVLAGICCILLFGLINQWELHLKLLKKIEFYKFTCTCNIKLFSRIVESLQESLDDNICVFEQVIKKVTKYFPYDIAIMMNNHGIQVISTDNHFSENPAFLLQYLRDYEKEIIVALSTQAMVIRSYRASLEPYQYKFYIFTLAPYNNQSYMIFINRDYDSALQREESQFALSQDQEILLTVVKPLLAYLYGQGANKRSKKLHS